MREALLGGEFLRLGAFGERIHADVDFAELAGAARLLLVPVAALGVGLDRFAIGNLRLLDLDLDLVAALEPLAEQQQVQLAHAGEHHFLGLGVVLQVDGAVFLGDLVERAGELGFVAAGLGRDGQADHRRGELQRRQLHFAERRAGVQLFVLGDGDDVARAGVVDVGRLVGLHGEQRADLDALAMRRATARVESFLSVPEKMRMKLSRCTNGSIRVLNTWAASGAAGSGLSVTVSPSLVAVRATAVGGSEHCSSTREQLVDADAGLGRDADDRRERPLPNRLDAEPVELLLRRHLALEVLLHHRFVGLDDRLEHRFADLGRIDQRTLGVARHVERADDALEVVPLPQRHVEQRAARAEHFADRVDQLREVDVVGVELGDAEDAAQAGVARFLPRAAGVDLDAGVGVDRDQRRVDGPQGADRLADEVRVAGRVDDVEPLAAVIEMDDRRLDRVLVVLLFFVEVADAGAGVDAGLAADRAGLHQQVVDERRLAGGAVPTNRDVANVLDVSSP